MRHVVQQRLSRRRFLLGGAGVLGVVTAGGVQWGADWRVRRWRTRAVELRPQADGSAVVLDRRRAFALNANGLALWRLCDGRHDGAQLLAALVEQTGIGRRRAAADVEAFLGEMIQAGLVEGV